MKKCRPAEAFQRLPDTFNPRFILHTLVCWVKMRHCVGVAARLAESVAVGVWLLANERVEMVLRAPQRELPNGALEERILRITYQYPFTTRRTGLGQFFDQDNDLVIKVVGAEQVDNC
jgi:hypothetical protein